LPEFHYITTFSVITSSLSTLETLIGSRWEEQERQEGAQGGRRAGEVRRGRGTFY